MDSTHWAQGIGLLKKTLMEEGGDLVINSSFLSSNKNNNNSSSIRARIHEPSSSSSSPLEENKKNIKKKKKEEVHKYCPRCNSTNTKFCYYNNYSLTQPRYFCKTCRRYWTEGGSLRNVPVGGGSRKNKKHSSSSSNYPDTNINPSSSSSSTKMILQQPPQNSNYYQQPFDHQVQDLNLSFLNNNNNDDSGGPILGIPMTMMPAVLPDHDMFPFGEMKQDQQLMFWNNGMMGGDGSW